MCEETIMLLSGIRTVDDMVEAFSDEARCRRILEAMVWPNGRLCPACGYKHSIAIAGRDMGNYRSRPGLYQCSSGDCHFQFTVTTRTPLHATKLPLSTWLKAMWLMLQSDKGLSSVRLAEALGVSQPTAWRMGHALRLMVSGQHMMEGTVEIDHFYFGGEPENKHSEGPPSGKGRKKPGKLRFWQWSSDPMAQVRALQPVTPVPLSYPVCPIAIRNVSSSPGSHPGPILSAMRGRPS